MRREDSKKIVIVSIALGISKRIIEKVRRGPHVLPEILLSMAESKMKAIAAMPVEVFSTKSPRIDKRRYRRYMRTNKCQLLSDRTK